MPSGVFLVAFFLIMSYEFRDPGFGFEGFSLSIGMSFGPFIK
jgi:hypothetical protein